ncbi:MAG: riboflavin biosynthesis protein RibF [Bdellovibrionota bacterium]
MQVFESALNLPSSGDQKRLILLGNFDGFHMGHHALLQEAVKRKNSGDLFTIFTFEPHPSQILLPRGDHRRLWGPLERRNYLETFKVVDELIEQKFDPLMSNLEPQEFWDKFILPLNPTQILTGEDFKFGKGRGGDSNWIKEACAKKGINYFALTIVQEDGSKVSSSRIKEAFMDGHFKKGLQWLGHDYFIIGPVIKGEERGRTLGFPTANIQLSFRPSLKLGVYAVSTELENTFLPGIMNIGTTPTFKSDLSIKCEVHFFDFEEDIYGQIIKVKIHDFIRPEQQFSSRELLLQQIYTDVNKAKKVFNP